MVYAWDTFETYRLRQADLESFLTRIFGAWDFFINIQNGFYRFWIPTPLTEIMPSFLDFIFPFGNQVGAKDAYFSGLRDGSVMTATNCDAEVPQLHRSGRELRLCYNLRSVEPSGSDPQIPWSIRQCAVYHSYDIQTGRALWVTVKGNELIKERIQDEEMLLPFTQAKSRPETFSSTLDVHLMLCDWASENWRWYLNDLERKVQRLAPGAMVIPVDKPRTPPPQPINLLRSPTQRMGSFPTVAQSPTSAISPRSKTGTFSSKFPSRSSTIIEDSDTKLRTEHSSYGEEKWINAALSNTKPLQRSLNSLYSTLNKLKTRVSEQRSSPILPSTSERRSTPVGDLRAPAERPPNFLEGGINTAHDHFKFEDLQNAEYIDQKLQDALLHLRLDVGVLGELRQFYEDAMAHKDLPTDIKDKCAAQHAYFDKCVSGSIKDMLMLQSRVETLLQLLSNRKHLLNCILQHMSTKANDSFAKKAHDSARFMEAMTIEMHSIAKKTERETVSMRAITSVTLFFLPATFLASFMSTDILDFKDGKQDLQMTGLKVYLAIALPATFLTFLAWYLISRSAKAKAGTVEGEQPGFDAA
ncbi:uncharacterized protein CC84DRAFT_1140220 [Paraphaeosphaeria sporulosa]|uniref:CorA-like transporter domain-containing protein n=1 Tax=Paraphaeosphaeria sporulosa TaxID=1460663 RepID=A0A177CK68_9PLEO|nr:uncharacterized protein CC84DRAFT_1140220 [Paraphaeosphaeria sporulosa]OAG07883.1 hypothetical protein CC84DRAFT_1140220 [Paraphaeosphaeria sporulosa]